MKFGNLISSVALFAAITLPAGVPVFAAYVIPNGAVKTAKIADGAVTQAKLAARTTGTTVAAGGVAVSGSCGAFTTFSTTPVDVTSLSVTITTLGRPVVVALVPDSNGSGSAGVAFSSLNGNLAVRILRGATVVLNSEFGGGAAMEQPASSIQLLDQPSAGTYTYKVQASSPTGSSASLSFARLIAYEI